MGSDIVSILGVACIGVGIWKRRLGWGRAALACGVALIVASLLFLGGLADMRDGWRDGTK